MQDLRYPIGQVSIPEVITEDSIISAMNHIMSLPFRLKQATDNQSEEQLNTPYHKDGWTIRQVVHHISESHMNGLIRFKWALTEETPNIKA